ncbi:MAG: hypothetical protein JO237_14145 [Pseudolabrys sp.]|nr:hypothetical protein [Pseudolabrys sp.]
MPAEQSRIDHALTLIRDFARATHRNMGFPHIGEARLVAGMIERVNDPTKQNQAAASLCGPAAFLYCLLNAHPEQYVQYVVDLYLTGKARIGSLKVEPSVDCRYYAPPADRIAPVDWIALASLCDSENTTLTYSSVDDTAAGITMPHSLAHWLGAAGFSGVKNDTNLVHRKGRKDVEAAKQEADLFRRVCLFINANLLDAAKQTKKSMFPDHWAVIEKNPQIVNDAVSLSVYSWGSIVSIPNTGALSIDDFTKNFYGVVSAKPT